VASIGEVSDVRTISTAQFGQLLDRLGAITWPLSLAARDALVAEWGWTVLSTSRRGSLSADPGYGMTGPGLARFGADDGEIDTVSVALADWVDEPSTTDRAVLRDSYADLVAVVVQRLGPPAGVESADADVTSHWELSNGCRLVLYRTPESNLLEITSPAEAAARRAM
jgi:hypothetical protein